MSSAGSGKGSSPRKVSVSAALTTAVGAVPVVGTLLVNYLSAYRTEEQERRLQWFVQEFTDRLTALREDALDDDYAHSQDYAAYLGHAMDIVATSHRRGKISLLAAVAAGAARPDSDIWRDKCLAACETLTSEHVAVLAAMPAGPVCLVDKDGIDEPPLSQLAPGYDHEDLVAIVRDLTALGFAEDVGPATYDGVQGELWERTSVGARFLAFLRTP